MGGIGSIFALSPGEESVETVGEQKIWTYHGEQTGAEVANCETVRESDGHRVNNYMDLATKIAELQFKNRDFILLFRGQPRDFRNEDNHTSLKPTIMRAGSGRPLPDRMELQARYRRLNRAEQALVGEYRRRNQPDPDRLERMPILRWSILQHYRVCPTPLLDVTHSLRIAASFGSENERGDCFLYVLAVPHISGAITASAEAGLQIVRLASVCPPTAVRPHIQEGYLLGEYPDMLNSDQKQLYPHWEVDFGRRMVAKFRFDPDNFWETSASFPRVPTKALYPGARVDPLCELALAVETEIGPA